MKLFTFLSAMLIFIGTSYGQKRIPEMVPIQGGSFMMGSAASDNPDEKPVHEVTLPNFLMSKFEVTVDEYTLFCLSSSRKTPKGNPRQAVMNISWEDAVKYCNWLSSIDGKNNAYTIMEDSSNFKIELDLTSNGYRLPTEAEWEYAARGGLKSNFSAYSGGYIPDVVAWNIRNSGNRQHDVGQKAPNELGLYDMSGNVREWCWDYYKPDYYKTCKDNSDNNSPTGPETGVERVLRGGHYMCQTVELRVFRRSRAVQTDTEGLAGIRLVRSE